MITMKSRMIVIASIVTCFLIQAQGADKYTDENRPYEFGFSIDGEQHRHEKKDEKGLIMGEFGFITADGVYHVTVYATDEQGRFKILSMKNLRVKPYPTYTGKQSTTSARQGHSLDLPASPQAPALLPPTTTNNPLKPISLEPPGKSCSSCSIPTTSTAATIVNSPFSGTPNQIAIQESAKFPEIQSQTPFTRQQNNINSPFPQQAFGVGTAQTPNSPNLPQASLDQELVPPPQYQTEQQNGFIAPQIPLEHGQISGPGSNSQAGIPQGPSSIHTAQSPGSPAFSSQPRTPALRSQPETPFPSQSDTLSGINQQGGQNAPQYGGDSQSSLQNVPSLRSPKRLDDQPPFGSVGSQPNSIQRGSAAKAGFNQGAQTTPSKPTLISAQMQIVDKNTDIYRLGPGENKGLPKGLTKDDMTHLLYTFNYTVGFHGHFEEGYTNGVKQGYYFVTGRNGVRTRIDYIADSEGFHPKISEEVLDLLSEDVPKPDTEKDDKYGLKGYEFKWLYYPIEDKTR